MTDQRSPPAYDEHALREGVISTAIAMNAAGINRGESGNVSARLRHRNFDGYLITPSGVPYGQVSAEQVVAMTLAGEYRGSVLPSSEWRFHRDIYAVRADVHAIVHAHSPFATSLACLRHDIPAFHYMVAVAGGKDIRCASYATFGTQELSNYVVAAMVERRACLLANHGMVAVGATLERALALAMEVETLAEMYLHALQIGEPVVLTDAEMDVVLEKFRKHGQPVC